jgi:histidyl-tRNA synthetase
MSSSQPARGMRDFLPADVKRRRQVIDTIARTYERYGFEPLETPAVENIETLMGKYGEEGNRLIFKILKRGEHEASGQADLALRYDLTVPLARVVANYRATLPRFFKRYQIQPVWRADRPARGRFREFYQCDADVLGSRSMVVEAELCAAACDALVDLGFEDFTVRLNHRRLLTGMLDVAGIEPARQGEALVVLDKLDKIGAEGVREEFRSKGLAESAASAILGLARAGSSEPSSSDDLLTRIARFAGTHPEGQRGVAELREILQLAGATPAAGRVRFDPTLARGLSYYTGAIMETAVPDLAGSLGGGGRYDNLVGMFLGQDVPACGFSLGLERLIVVMAERGMFSTALTTAAADVMLTQLSAEGAAEVLRLAGDLRRSGLRVDVYPEADKLGKQFKYASAQGTPFVAVLGGDELARGEVTVKDLRSGEQRSVPRNDVVALIASSLTAPTTDR